jgi:hypothetical protein
MWMAGISAALALIRERLKTAKTAHFAVYSTLICIRFAHMGLRRAMAFVGRKGRALLWLVQIFFVNIIMWAEDEKQPLYDIECSNTVEGTVQFFAAPLTDPSKG